jgi:hypothetical protein
MAAISLALGLMAITNDLLEWGIWCAVHAILCITYETYLRLEAVCDK